MKKHWIVMATAALLVVACGKEAPLAPATGITAQGARGGHMDGDSTGHDQDSTDMDMDSTDMHHDSLYWGGGHGHPGDSTHVDSTNWGGHEDHDSTDVDGPDSTHVDPPDSTVHGHGRHHHYHR